MSSVTQLVQELSALRNPRGPTLRDFAYEISLISE